MGSHQLIQKYLWAPESWSQRVNKNIKAGQNTRNLQHQAEQAPAHAEAAHRPEVPRVARDAQLDGVGGQDERQVGQEARDERVRAGVGLAVADGQLLVQRDQEVEQAHGHARHVERVGARVPVEVRHAEHGRHRDEHELDHVGVPRQRVREDVRQPDEQQHDVGEEREAQGVRRAHGPARPAPHDGPLVPAPVHLVPVPLADVRADLPQKKYPERSRPPAK
jgi:hypothetical protein